MLIHMDGFHYKRVFQRYIIMHCSYTIHIHLIVFIYTIYEYYVPYIMRTVFLARVEKVNYYFVINSNKYIKIQQIRLFKGWKSDYKFSLV